MPSRRLTLPIAVILCSLWSCGLAQAGGAIRAYALLPGQGRLAVIDADAGRVVGTVAVPRGPGPMVASVDGSRLLVVDTRLGLVTQIDGIHARRVRAIRGLGRPVALALVPQAQSGLVRPRYAIVADARGWIDTLDLVAGRIVARTATATPAALAVEHGRLWVASAGESTLTLFALGTRARPHLVARADAGVVPVALAPWETSSATGVDVISRTGLMVRIDGYSLATAIVGRFPGPFSQLLEGHDGIDWAAASDGRVLGVRTADGRVAYVMRVARASRLLIVGGWLGAAHGRALSMFALATHRQPETVALPGAVSGLAFAILP